MSAPDHTLDPLKIAFCRGWYQREVELIQQIGSCGDEVRNQRDIPQGVVDAGLEDLPGKELVDAAPDLLEALGYARRFLKVEDHDVAYVDAAIAKARGEDA